MSDDEYDEEEDIDGRTEKAKQARFEMLADLTEEEKEALKDYPYPLPDAKHNVHTFLNEVHKTKDTTKVGYLKEEELGVPSNPVRVYKEMELISRVICQNKLFADYFASESENTLATSLSREGKLINLAIMQKRVIEDATKFRKPNTGWFKKKEPAEGME